MIRKLGANPVLYLDSINIDNEQLAAIKPTDVAALSTYNGKEATDILGDDGKDGIVYIFTKKYAKNSYWNYFKSKSQEYSDKVVSPESDSTVQYILNKRILTTNFEGDLVGVNDKIFKEIVIINKETLISEYKILDKDFGVLIKSDIPENLYHAKKHY
ncbi:MAG: hypothetical protein ABUT20_11980 [Bacteroidota bacterium]